MRDPVRIDHILIKLQSLWKQVPDWRFCQLIVNLVGEEDPFHLEDDEFLLLVNQMLEEVEREEVDRKKREAS